MAEAEPDWNTVPLTDRWVHKSWKARKHAYEAAAAQFEKTADEYDPAFKPFLLDTSLLKAAVLDSNVAAQQDGVAALCAFLKYGGRENCLRTRAHTVTPILEKGLVSTRPQTKAFSLEALLLYIELDVPGPVIEEILPILSAKQPKVIAAALATLTQIFHNYGCKLADPKPVLKALLKVFGHADKNVRAEATNLTVELFRWLRDAIKPMLWSELKPAQQTDLETQFEKVREEATPKQERLLRTQQEAKARAPAGGDEEYDDADDGPEEPVEVDVFDLAEPQDILKSVPASFYDRMASPKWSDRKEAVEELYGLLKVPRIKDGDFHEINRVLAKCMKDANIAVVTQAAICIEALAQGLRKGYGKYRATIMQPILERLKEKKVTVTDALGKALDQVFLATSLTDCLEDITAYLVHKNPQVKENTTKFLVRCLRNTREVPSKAEIQSMVQLAKKLLAESTEGLRAGGAEILGTIMKIIGERGMNPHLDGLDEIRKTKIKEFFDSAEVKAKERPKPIIAPPKPAAAPPRKVMGGAKKAPAKKAAAAPPPPPKEEPLAPQPTPRAAAGKLGMPKASGLGGLKAPGKRALGGPPGAASPRRPPSAAPPPTFDDEPEFEPTPIQQPKLGMGRGGLAGRSLAKPGTPAPMAAPPSPAPSSGLMILERAELEELRDANERLTRLVEESRHERSKLLSEIQELKNQNAGLIEDHTRDVLSIKAKETQLVRARSDAEAAEGTNERLRRELERLKKALNKAESHMQAQNHHMAELRSNMGSPVGSVSSPTHDEAGIYRDGGGGSFSNGSANGRNRISYSSTLSEEKENGSVGDMAPPAPYGAGARNSKLSPDMRYGNGGASSPARGFRRDPGPPPEEAIPMRPTYSSGHSSYSAGGGGGSGPAPANGVESWKRAAEVTSQLKARIEQMKAKQGFSRP
ncbi:hypothetical protein GGTG_02397 [Gaeumannomyces tritici R3-111a-1]|uniref:TOG domain-containing protein n=1 Tax=Gaeumannomyces tritici (strain R3-111a-1) TaxID=644352 RepID=J3NM93_GAET3|nr:hypothetical protein GGTG_02397 [Gaeumannomyces tritici R3-111a-1]EJT82424.1 hypothetical protein GGTG_02397 [Gaeumannomyces tritici R3-111a-1]